jgi:hypothetical protein
MKDSSSTRHHESRTPDGCQDSGQFTSTSAAERLRERAAAEVFATHPAAWMPEPGDELVGTFRGLSSGPTRRGETHQIALVEDEAGKTQGVWLFYRVLADQFAKADPKPGDSILLLRRPDRTSEAGKTYLDFLVLVERANTEAPSPDPQTDWTFAGGQG